VNPFSPRIEELLSAQERVDALRQEATLRSGSALCDLAYANSYDGAPAEVLAALTAAIQPGRPLDLQYTPYGGSTLARRQVGDALTASHGTRFHFRDVVLTPGAMAALNVVFRSVADGSHGEVLVVTPCWLDYPLYLENLGLEARMVPVDPRTLRLDLGRIEAALSPRTRAIVLSQPANPTGLLYSAGELRQLAELLGRAPSRPLLISDECHRDFTFPHQTFVSPMTFYDRCCVIFSFGKSLFIQGQRLGYVAVSPRHPERRAFATLLERILRTTGFCTPTALMQRALGDLIGLRPNLDSLLKRRARTLEVLTRSGYLVAPSQATFFLYPETPGGDDFAFTERLAHRGVLVLPAPVFHHQGHFRISLTASDAMLDRALDVLTEKRVAA
jgi:aspartate aminotransferase